MLSVFFAILAVAICMQCIIPKVFYLEQLLYNMFVSIINGKGPKVWFKKSGWKSYKTQHSEIASNHIGRDGTVASDVCLMKIPYPRFTYLVGSFLMI